MIQVQQRKNRYFNLLKTQVTSHGGGVLFLHGRPGLAKSAIMKQIAEENNLMYIDIRLSTADETDLGAWPIAEKVEGANGKYEVLYGIPRFVRRATESINTINPKTNEKYSGAIVHFEEFNRASSSVRNAAMGILLERVVAQEETIPSYVYLVASGNLGDSDGTEVEEIDAAQKNRFIHIHHDINSAEWLQWAEHNGVHDYVCSFIKAHPNAFYPENVTDNEGDYGAFPTPRSWTYVSNYIISLEESGKPDNEITSILTRDVKSFVGQAYGSKFCTFVNEYINNKVVSAQLIFNDFKSIRKKLDKLDESNFHGILTQVESYDWTSLDVNHAKNFVMFLEYLSKRSYKEMIVAFVQNTYKPSGKSHGFNKASRAVVDTVLNCSAFKEAAQFHINNSETKYISSLREQEN